MMVRCCDCCPVIRHRINKKIVLLLVGLDNAGKTTAARGLAGGIVDDVIPTVGFSSIKLKHRGLDVYIYDLGGGSQIRAIWKSYFSDVHGVIFVVDASDASRIEECKYVLESLLRDERLAGKPVLVLANKQDKAGAMDQVDLVESLRLEPLVNEQKCLTLLEECSALDYASKNKSDPRILHGYRWLLNQIIHDYDTLNVRVEKDKQMEAEKFEAHRKELRQRFNKNLENGHSNLPVLPNGNSHNLPYGDRIIHVSPPPAIINEQAPNNNNSNDNGSDISSSSNNNIQDLTRHVKDQLERHNSKGRRRSSLTKKNKILPLNVNEIGRNGTNGITSCSKQRSLNDLEDDKYLMVEALTSPFMKRNNVKLKLPPIKAPGALRPPTSKSLGHEGTPWDLDKELEVVYPLNNGQITEFSDVKNFNETEAS